MNAYSRGPTGVQFGYSTAEVLITGGTSGSGAAVAGIGWLTTPVINYGYEIQSMNLLRLVSAYEDLETADLIAELS